VSEYVFAFKRILPPQAIENKRLKSAVGTTEKPNGCSDVAFFIVLDNRSVELSWQRKIANMDRIQRKNQLIPFVMPPIVFFCQILRKPLLINIIKTVKTK
jgi:hypothetical protein